MVRPILILLLLCVMAEAQQHRARRVPIRYTTAAGGGTSVTDDFNRADSGSIGANYTQSATTIAIVSNQAKLAGGGAFATAFYSGASFAGNQYARCTIVDLGEASSATELKVMGAGAGATQDGYVLILVSDGDAATTSASLQEIVDDSYSSLDTDASTWTEGDVIELRISSGTLTVYKNAVLVSGFTATDTTLTSGAPGFNMYDNGGAGVIIDDFAGGDL